MAWSLLSAKAFSEVDSNLTEGREIENEKKKQNRKDTWKGDRKKE